MKIDTFSYIYIPLFNTSEKVFKHNSEITQNVSK